MQRKKNIILWVGAAVAVVGLLGYNTFSHWLKRSPSVPVVGINNSDIPCINPNLPIPNDLHIHPQLSIVINGSRQTVPANIGLGGQWGCERALHTHDMSGTIHIEPNFPQMFTLGQFFAEWGKTFSNTQIFDNAVDRDHEIVMTVDGVASQEFGNLVLKDKQQIVIEYKKVEAKK